MPRRKPIKPPSLGEQLELLFSIPKVGTKVRVLGLDATGTQDMRGQIGQIESCNASGFQVWFPGKQLFEGCPLMLRYSACEIEILEGEPRGKPFYRCKRLVNKLSTQNSYE